MASWEMAWVRTQSLPSGAALLGPHVLQEEFVYPEPVDWRPLGDNNCAKLNRWGGESGIFVNASGRGMAAMKYLPDDAPLFCDQEVLVFHHVQLQHKSILVRRLNCGTLVLMVDIKVAHVQWRGAWEVQVEASRAMTGVAVYSHAYDTDEVITVSKLARDIHEHIIMQNPRSSANFKCALVRGGTVEHLDPGRQVWNPRWPGKLASPEFRIAGKQKATMQHTLHHFFVKKNKGPVVSLMIQHANKVKSEARAAAKKAAEEAAAEAVQAELWYFA
jgi:hypothetical protein